MKPTATGIAGIALGVALGYGIGTPSKPARVELTPVTADSRPCGCYSQRLHYVTKMIPDSEVDHLAANPCNFAAGEVMRCGRRLKAAVESGKP